MTVEVITSKSGMLHRLLGNRSQHLALCGVKGARIPITLTAAAQRSQCSRCWQRWTLEDEAQYQASHA